MKKIVLEIDGQYSKYEFSGATTASRLTIGRAFSNDIIIADSYVGSSQLILTPSEDNKYCWKLTIVDHTNPVLLNRKKPEGSECGLQSGDSLTIGRTTITFYNEDHVISDTKAFSFANWLHNHQLNPLFACLMLLALFAITLIMSILDTSVDLEWGKYSAIAMIPVALSFIWASGWSLIGRFLKTDYYYFSHVFLTAFCFSLLMLSGEVYSYFDYIFSSVLVGELVDLSISILIFGLLISFNLALVSNGSRPLRSGMLSSACIVGLITAVIYLYADDYENEPSHTATIKPSYVPTPAPQNVDRFIEEYRDLFAQLNSEQ